MLINIIRRLSYSQGQYFGKTREYFYYIDHQGMLFMDDARIKNFTSCFKEQKFLQFFFTRIKENEVGRYKEEFPYVSPCGREMNFIRCDDLPIVYTKLDRESNQLIWVHANELKVRFQPEKIHMNSKGRIYHPHPTFPFVGLIASKVAIEISNNFIFSSSNNRPVKFLWNDKEYILTQECEELLNKFRLNKEVYD